jgi:hypothetical protein
MARIRRSKQDPEIRHIQDKRKREKELTALIDKPSDRVSPRLDKATNLKWEQFNQKRLEVVEDLLQIAKDHKAIVDAQKELSPDEQDLRVLVATLDFYDPNESAMDNTIEIVIRHEEE